MVCGKVLPGHQLQVRDTAGKLLADREVGRIFVKAPSIMPGYYHDPEATREVLSADGWLDTGDLGYTLTGDIVVTGRAKDLIIVNGRNIWPQDIEWTIEAQNVVKSDDARPSRSTPRRRARRGRRRGAGRGREATGAPGARRGRRGA